MNKKYYTTNINFSFEAEAIIREACWNQKITITEYIHNLIYSDAKCKELSGINKSESADIILRNTAGALYDDELLKNAIMWYTDGNYRKVMTISASGNYPTFSFEGRRIEIHRVLMMYKMNTKDLDGIVHHIDENKFNANIDNLAIMDLCSHIILHHGGKVLSDEHKRKLSEGRKAKCAGKREPYKKNILSEKIYLMRQNGMSYKEIGRTLNISDITAKNRFMRYLENK